MNKFEPGDRVLHLGTSSGARKNEIFSVISFIEHAKLTGGHEGPVYMLDGKSEVKPDSNIGAAPHWLRKLPNESTNGTNFEALMSDLNRQKVMG